MVEINNPGGINPTGGIAKTGAGSSVSKKEQAGPSFEEVLRESLDEVNSLQHHAGESIQKLVTGEIKDLSQVMVAVEEANTAFEFTMQIRNRIMQAYEEVMRMQV